MAEKLPPHDIDAEEAVIGSLLIDGTAIRQITSSSAVSREGRVEYDGKVTAP